MESEGNGWRCAVIVVLMQKRYCFFFFFFFFFWAPSACRQPRQIGAGAGDRASSRAAAGCARAIVFSRGSGSSLRIGRSE